MSKIKNITYYTPIISGVEQNDARMIGECCDFECFEKGDAVCFDTFKPMTITVDWANVRGEGGDWNRLIEVSHLIPSKWPKGQSILDRMYWCSVGLGQSTEDGTKYDWRLSGLLDSAIALLGKGK